MTKTMVTTRFNKILKPIVGGLPFFMVAVTFFTSIASATGFYHKFFYLLPDSLGYSIATNIVFWYHYSFKKYCNATRVAVGALTLMNIISLATKKTQYYNTLHDAYITILLVVVLVALKFSKKW